MTISCGSIILKVPNEKEGILWQKKNIVPAVDVIVIWRIRTAGEGKHIAAPGNYRRENIGKNEQGKTEKAAEESAGTEKESFGEKDITMRKGISTEKDITMEKSILTGAGIIMRKKIPAGRSMNAEKSAAARRVCCTIRRRTRMRS